MKILCFHGAGTNASILETQLGPLTREIQRDTGASFYFVEGQLDSPPAHGIDSLFEGPYYSFYPWSYEQDSKEATAIEEVYDLIYEAIETDGPFDAILGFSQGATLAYSFLMHHAKSHPYEIPSALVKCAIFFCGLSPFVVDAGTVIFEEQTFTLLVPSLHIVCKQDPYYKYSMALYERCEKEAATCMCLDLGHVIPRDSKSTRAIGYAIRQLFQRALFVH